MARTGLTDAVRMFAWTMSWLVVASLAYLYTTWGLCDIYVAHCRRGSWFWLAAVVACTCMGIALTPKLVLSRSPLRIIRALFITGVFLIIVWAATRH